MRGVMSHDDDKSVTLVINKRYEKALISAFQKFKNNVPLSKEDEEILATLWHEFIHLRTKDLFKFYDRLEETDKCLLETITEFIARHTYDKFFEMLRPGTKPNHQKEIIENALGYQTEVWRFRYVLQKFNINEKEAVKELESILFEDGQNIKNRLKDWLRTKADLLENESDDILHNIIHAMSDEKFQKKVDKYYEISKRRKK
jgi:hypothetical protein